MPLDAAVLVDLIDLVGEEGVEDGVDQLGGGGLGGSLAVLLDLGGVAYGLSPGGPPVKATECFGGTASWV